MRLVQFLSVVFLAAVVAVLGLREHPIQVRAAPAHVLPRAQAPADGPANPQLWALADLGAASAYYCPVEENGAMEPAGE